MSSLRKIIEELGNQYIFEDSIGRNNLISICPGIDRSNNMKIRVYALESPVAEDESFLDELEYRLKTYWLLKQPQLQTIKKLLNKTPSPHFITASLPSLDLATYLEHEGRIDLNRVIKLTSQMGRLLEFLHDNKIFHLGLNPKNIFLGYDFVPILANTPLTQTLSGSNYVEEAEPYLLFQYLSPEQTVGMEGNASSDVFSLGILAYHLLRGEPPYTGKTLTEVAQSHLTTQLIVPDSIDNDAGRDLLEKVIFPCLQLNQGERLQTIAEVVRALDELSAPKEVQPPPGPVKPPRMKTALKESLVTVSKVGLAALQKITDWKKRFSGITVNHLLTRSAGVVLVGVAALLLIVMLIYLNGDRGRKSPGAVHGTHEAGNEDRERKPEPIPSLSSKDRHLIEKRIEAIGMEMGVSEDLIVEAQYIVDQPGEGLDHFIRLINKYNPVDCKPYSGCWKEWYDFGHLKELFPGSPAKGYARRIAEIIAP